VRGGGSDAGKEKQAAAAAKEEKGGGAWETEPDSWERVPTPPEGWEEAGERALRERRTERNRRRRDHTREVRWELSEAKRDPDAFAARERASRAATLAGGPIPAILPEHAQAPAATPPEPPTSADGAPPDGMTREAQRARDSGAAVETDAAGLTDTGRGEARQNAAERTETAERGKEGEEKEQRGLRPRNLAGAVVYQGGRGRGVFGRGGGRN
jgi:hypothetical protein